MTSDGVWTASFETLKTRREVRSFLADGLSQLVGGLAQQDRSRELAGLAIGSDREVIDSYRSLEAGLTARDARYASVLVSADVRDLFAKALQRMKELPPDPREILHAKPPKALGLQPLGQIRSIRPGLRQSMVFKARSTRIRVKHAREVHALSR